MKVDVLCDPAVDKGERHPVGVGAGPAAQLDVGRQHAPDGRKNDRQISGQTPGHDRIDGHLFHRGDAVHGGNRSQNRVGGQIGAGQHLIHGLTGGRDDRQAGGPAQLVELVVDLLKGTGKGIAGIIPGPGRAGLLLGERGRQRGGDLVGHPAYLRADDPLEQRVVDDLLARQIAKGHLYQPQAGHPLGGGAPFGGILKGPAEKVYRGFALFFKESGVFCQK